MTDENILKARLASLKLLKKGLNGGINNDLGKEFDIIKLVYDSGQFPQDIYNNGQDYLDQL